MNNQNELKKVDRLISKIENAVNSVQKGSIDATQITTLPDLELKWVKPSSGLLTLAYRELAVDVEVDPKTGVEKLLTDYSEPLRSLARAPDRIKIKAFPSLKKLQKHLELVDDLMEAFLED